MNDNRNEKNNDAKGIAIISVGIMTIVVAIAGATFAFFQVTATANNISGQSAYSATPLTLTITDATSATVGSKNLIPQLDQDIQTAVTGSSEGTCLDSAGNAVCKVYSITVKNSTTTNFYLSGSLEFTTNPTTTSTTGMPNLKWAKGTSTTTGFPSTTTGPFYSSFDTFTTNSTSTTQSTVLADTFYLGADASQTYYVVVWISETGAAQTDNGTFTGTVSFTGYSSSDGSLQGVTSTITS